MGILKKDAFAIGKRTRHLWIQRFQAYFFKKERE